MRIQKIGNQWISERIQSDLIRSTRIHKLPSSNKTNTLYIKREDELSSGISGSKLRKYASVIRHLIENNIEEVALIGGPNSNHLVGLLQILKEHDIHAWLFIREAGDSTKQGNALFLDMLAPESSITIIPREQWTEATRIAQSFLETRNIENKKTLLIPEGGLHETSLPGALTLAQDILKNESTHGTVFTDLFVDSGTGMTAIGLILGLAALDPNAFQRSIHITLIAGEEHAFRAHLDQFSSYLGSALNHPIPPFSKLNFLKPPTCKAFGSVKPSLFTATREISRTEGLLMDPTYSVKHYLSMKEYITQSGTSSSLNLFIYNGSTLGLSGFQAKL